MKYSILSALILITFSFGRSISLPQYIQEVLGKFDKIDVSGELALINRKIKTAAYNSQIEARADFSRSGQNFERELNDYSNFQLGINPSARYTATTAFGTSLNLRTMYDRMNSLQRFLVDPTATNLNKDLRIEMSVSQSFIHGLFRYCVVSQLAQQEYRMEMLDLEKVRNDVLRSAVDQYIVCELNRRNRILVEEQMEFLADSISGFLKTVSSDGAKLKVMEMKVKLEGIKSKAESLKSIELEERVNLADVIGHDLGKEDLVIEPLEDSSGHIRLYRDTVMSNLSIEKTLRQVAIQHDRSAIKQMTVNSVPDFTVFASAWRAFHETNQDTKNLKNNSINMNFEAVFTWAINSPQQRLQIKREKLQAEERMRYSTFDDIAAENARYRIEKLLGLRITRLEIASNQAVMNLNSLLMARSYMGINLDSKKLDESDFIALDRFFHYLEQVLVSKLNYNRFELEWVSGYYNAVMYNYNYLKTQVNQNYYNNNTYNNKYGNNPYYNYSTYFNQNMSTTINQNQTAYYW